jgi:hypothetical protein
MVISGRFKHAGDGGSRPLLFQESCEVRDPVLRIAKYLVDRCAILSQARYIELRLADIDANTHY